MHYWSWGRFKRTYRIQVSYRPVFNYKVTLWILSLGCGREECGCKERCVVHSKLCMYLCNMYAIYQQWNYMGFYYDIQFSRQYMCYLITIYMRGILVSHDSTKFSRLRSSLFHKYLPELLFRGQLNKSLPTAPLEVHQTVYPPSTTYLPCLGQLQQGRHGKGSNCSGGREWICMVGKNFKRTNSCPVINALASLAMKTTEPLSSFGFPSRPIGVSLSHCAARLPAVSNTFWRSCVAWYPGHSAFTRILCGAHSVAMDLMRWDTAAFDWHGVLC